jgi:TetR/AcrR family transcriptional regulator
MREAVSPNIDAGARRRLQVAALELFNRKGYASTSVREIVELAGVTKPVLYYHFGSKEGIYLALLEDALAVLRETMRTACEWGGSVRERITHVSRELYQISMENIEVVRLIYAAYYGPQHGAPAFDLDPFQHAFTDVLDELVAEGIERGELRTTDPQLATLALHGAATSTLEASLAHPELGLDASVVQALLDLMFDGIAVPTARGEGEGE